MKLVELEDAIDDNYINLYNQDFDELSWHGTDYDNCTVLKIHSIGIHELDIIIDTNGKEVD